MILLSIDPGTTVSGVVIYDTDTREVIAAYPEMDNHDLKSLILFDNDCDHMVIEMIASYGMAVGKTVFETVRWIGIFQQAFGIHETTLIYRMDVKMELCNSARAKDANIRQAIIDRYEPTGGGATPQMGTKKQPGPLYGVTKHAVAALGVAITWAALQQKEDL